MLIIGSGSAGQRHLEIARAFLPKANIRVLRHRPSNKAIRLADGCFFQAKEALDFRPQIAVVANPAAFHIDISTRLASAGCHLLVEKPIAHTTRGVEKLIQVAEARKIVLQVGYNLRFLLSLQKFRQQILTHQIGQIVSVHAEVGQFLPSWRPAVEYRKTVSAQAELGGGVLLELSHEIDYLRWIFGEIAWVSAWIGRVGGLEVDVEDSAKLTLGFEGGPLSSGGVATLTMDFIRKDPTRFCHAVGSKGSLKWDGLCRRVEKYSSKPKIWNDIYKQKNKNQESYTKEWKSFLSCVSSGGKPMVTGHDGLAVLKTVEAAKRSHQQKGLRINVPKFGIK